MKKSKRGVGLLLAVGQIALLLMNGKFLLAADVIDRIVAVVGEEIILESDLRGRPLDSLIREKLMRLEIKKLGLEVSDQELSSALQNILARNHLTLEGLKGELAAKGIPFEAYKNQVREEVKQMKFVGQVIFPRIKVSEEEINRKLKGKGSEEERQRVRQAIAESKITGELNKYLDEVRAKTYVEVKN